MPISASRPAGLCARPSSSLQYFSRSFDPHDCRSSPNCARLLRRRLLQMYVEDEFTFSVHCTCTALSQLLAYIYILSFLIFTLYSQLAPVRRSPQSAVAKSGSAVVSIDGGDLRRRVPTVSAAKSTTDDVLVHLNILEISKSI